MKYLFIGIALYSLLVLNGCNKDNSELCKEDMVLNESFIGKKGCKYTYITSDNDTITVSVLNIIDRREYGTGCQLSMGGYADISISASINQSESFTTFLWRGCDGTTEYDPDMESLPKLELEDGYILKLMKMYPLSVTQENPPISEEDYGIRLIIMK